MRTALAAVAESEQRLDATVAALTDEQVRQPSLLPGWSRALVITHIARNADSNTAMVAAALRGEQLAQYPGGPEQRARDIALGDTRSAGELLADLRAAAAGWREMFSTVAGDQWGLIVPAGVGPRPVRQRVASRRLEVEVHHADLGLAYTWRDWPVDFVSDELRRAIRALPARWTPDAPVGRWRIGDRTVVVTSEGAEVVDATGDEDGEVDGSAAGLMAWLLGRVSAVDGELIIRGAPEVAALPGWFPFP